MRDLREGKKTWQKQATEIVQAPAAAFVNQWEPVTKSVMESVAGINSFPDPFHPRPLKEGGRDFLTSQGLQWTNDLYRTVTGTPIPPSRPGVFAPKATPGERVTRFLDFFIGFRTDPGESAYWLTRQRVSDWTTARKGEPGGPARLNEQQLALYYFKRASQWGDDAKAKEWLTLYYARGGTPQGMRGSVQHGDPLSSLPAKYHGQFLRGLDITDRAMVTEAQQWWRGDQRAPALHNAKGVPFHGATSRPRPGPPR